MSQVRTKGVSGEFVLRKLHSLTGFLPLCFFLAFHLLANGIALIDPALYSLFIDHFTSIPGLAVIEWIMIFIPLILHALVGLWLVFTGKNNPKSYGYSRNWMFFLQRITGLIIFAFIIWHVWTMKLSGLSPVEMYGAMNGIVSHPLGLIAMCVSLIAVSFHVCNGLWGFAINWGITPGMRAQSIWGKVTLVLFVLLSIFWLVVLKAFM